MTELSVDVSQELRRSVVKLFTVIKQPNHYQPWDLGYQKNSGGSACIVSGNRILTNAHVVRHQVYVQALKSDDSKKYSAQVEHVDHESELALLTVDDPKFFEGTVAVELGELPKRQARVVVYGFPMGGNDLCATAGVVSRIEVRRYTHSQRRLLALQVDAAINPGNSGGPVFVDGKLAGLAFQSHNQKDLQKSGYVVPVPIIRHFMKDIEDGEIGGVPDLGIYWQKIESATLAEWAGLSPDQTGVLVSRVVYGSSAWGTLEPDDVLLSVDGERVASDGSVLLREHDRVEFSYLVSRHQVGETLSLEVLRRGETLSLSVQLRNIASLVRPPRHDMKPTYYILGGVVFMPLTYEYLTVWDWKDVSARFRYYYGEVLPSERQKQIVLINQVLAHDINVGYHQIRGAVVERVNGVEITEMADVLRAAKTPIQGRHVIEIDYHGVPGDSSDYHRSNGTRIVIDATKEAEATAAILSQYGIVRDRSADLG